MTKEMTGAEMVIEAFADQNVEHVFGYPGGAVLPIYDAIFNQQKVKHVLVRHEQGAVHAAEGYARSTGKVGCVLVTSGPGAARSQSRAARPSASDRVRSLLTSASACPFLSPNNSATVSLFDPSTAITSSSVSVALAACSRRGSAFRGSSSGLPHTEARRRLIAW